MIANTATRYGLVARSLHWLTALLILTAIPLGLVANALPYDTSGQLAFKAQLFSVHKTLGLAAFAIALARILWALTQTRPAPIHPDRRGETLLAELVHWSLYVSLVAVPLSGWLHHAAAEGFAPILWPFGQSLPFVPKDPTLAGAFGMTHWLFTKVLAVSVILHVAGALKHALIDRDATLGRMWSGRDGGDLRGAHRPRSAAIAAVVVWLGALGGAFALSAPEADRAAPPAPLAQAAAGGWRVVEGSLTFTVRQMGASVQGSFADWAATIDFDPETGTGAVEVSIDVGSLTLGSVTGQALGSDFLDAAAHPTATFTAAIRPEGDTFVADGTLSLKGAEVPVTMPFTLVLDGDTASMAGAVTLDRRDFGIGQGFSDESQVGFAVEVTPALTAIRGD